MALKYQYVLTEVPFDSSYDNVIRFDTREQQEEYFGVSTLFVNAPSIDFNFGKLIKTEVIVKLDGSPLEVMGKNYLILKNTNENAKPKYLYYFIDSVEYLTGGNDESKTQARLILSLDIFNTYMLDIEFGEGTIVRRASLDRWIAQGDKIRMNFDIDSPFRIQDNFQENVPSLIELNRQSIVPLTQEDYSIKDDIVQWLNKNVSGWEYLYLDKNHKYNINNMDTISIANHIINCGTALIYMGKSDIEGYEHILNNNLYMSRLVDTIPDYGSICIPIYKSNKRIYVRMTTQNQSVNTDPLTFQYCIDAEGLNQFRYMNNDASYFFARKVSLVAPWSNLSNIKYEFDSKGNLIIIGNPSGKINVDDSESVTADYCGSSLEQNGESPRALTLITSGYAEDYLYSVPLNKDYVTNAFAYYWKLSDKKFVKPTENELRLFDFGTLYGVFVGLTQLNYKTSYTQEYEMSVPSKTTKEALKSSVKRQVGYCPKLYTAPYSALKLQCYGETIDYNLSDLWNGTESTKYVRFLFNEILMPEVTKYYLRPNPQGIYNDSYKYNLSGLVSTCDLSVAIVNTAYSEFLASNKNFWLQSLASSLGGSGSILNEMSTPRQQTYTTQYYYTNKKGQTRPTGSKVISGGYDNSLSFGNIGIEVAKLGLQVASGMVNSALTISNLKASPSTMKNATGNSYFLMSTNNLDICCSQMQLLDIDKQRIYDYYYEYGYPLNKIGKVEDYINIRHYFNYLQADCQNMHGKNGVTIPNSVRSLLKDTLSQGVRFWNVTDKMFQYDMENYENDL